MYYYFYLLYFFYNNYHIFNYGYNAFYYISSFVSWLRRKKLKKQQTEELDEWVVIKVK